MNRFIVFCFFSLITAVQAQNPQLTSWFTANSGKYARIYASTADETAGTKSTTWTRGTTTQASPAYSGVTEINYSPNWVYIRTTGLASHLMGRGLASSSTWTLGLLSCTSTACYSLSRRTPACAASASCTPHAKPERSLGSNCSSTLARSSTVAQPEPSHSFPTASPQPPHSLSLPTSA